MFKGLFYKKIFLHLYSHLRSHLKLINMELEYFVVATTAGLLLAQGSVSLTGVLEVNNFKIDAQTAVGLKHFYEPKEFTSVSTLLSYK